MESKLFIGTRMSPDLKAKAEGEPEPTLKCIPHEGKEFLGIYLDELNPSIDQMRVACDQVLDLIGQAYPSARRDSLEVVIFPQLFLG